MIYVVHFEDRNVVDLLMEVNKFIKSPYREVLQISHSITELHNDRFYSCMILYKDKREVSE